MPAHSESPADGNEAAAQQIDPRWIKGLTKAEAAARGEYGVEHMSKTRAKWAGERLEAKESEPGNPAVEAALQSAAFQELRKERVIDYNLAAIPLAEVAKHPAPSTRHQT